MTYRCDGVIETDSHVSTFSFGLTKADLKSAKQLCKSLLHPLPLEDVMQVRHIYVVSIGDEAPMPAKLRNREHLAFDGHMGKLRLVPASRKPVISDEARMAAKALLKHLGETVEIAE